MKRLKKLLIVDDVDLAHSIYRVRLDSMNVSILSAKSGSEAIAMISREDDIDLIILDLNMSSMDGLELLNILPIRAKQKIPVIVVSSEQDKAKQQMALQRGAVAFFDKSRIKELKRFIEHLFGGPEHINCALSVCHIDGEAGMRK
jgi:CheY-like chemotaxis protein